MSSTPAKAGGNKKPRRPLSGYNLFYRYKRIKVLEATSHPTNANGRSDEDLIREVVAALPGLEGVSPRSPIFASSPAHLDEFRATAIRAAMEGKLFPNENGRTRLHRKSHGVGFVEMGRMMRQLWGQADKFTKGVFCELAEVGRARYKKLAAEFRIEREKAKSAAIEAAGEAGISESKEPTQRTPDAKSPGTAGPAAQAAVIPSPAQEIDPMMVEALAREARTPPITNVSRHSQAAPAPAAEHLAATDATAPMTIKGEAKPTTNKPPPPSATAESPNSTTQKGPRPVQGYRRRVSTELNAAAAATAKASAGLTPVDGSRVLQPGFKRMVTAEDLFSPDAKDAGTNDARSLRNGPFETPTGPVKTRMVDGRVKQGKAFRTPASSTKTVLPPVDEGGASAKTREGRVSQEPSPVVHSGAGSRSPKDKAGKRRAGSRSPKGKKGDLAKQRLMLRKAIHKLKNEIKQNNKLLPPKMQVGPRRYRTSSSGDSSSPSKRKGAKNGSDGKVSNKDISQGTPSRQQEARIVLPEVDNTQDFVKMIGTLGAAIDESS